MANLFECYSKIAPKDGYLLKLWKQKAYRATALAYLQRENLTVIENENGEFYNIDQLKNSIINYYN